MLEGAPVPGRPRARARRAPGPRDELRCAWNLRSTTAVVDATRARRSRPSRRSDALQTQPPSEPRDPAREEVVFAVLLERPLLDASARELKNDRIAALHGASMARKVMVLVVLGAILFVIALFWPDRPVPEPQPSAPASGAVDAHGSRGSDLVSAASQAQPNEREEIAGAEQAAPRVSSLNDKEHTSIRGRCVRAEDKVPLAGCSILLVGSALNPGAAAMSAVPEWKRPEIVSTGSDGLF